MRAFASPARLPLFHALDAHGHALQQQVERMATILAVSWIPTAGPILNFREASKAPSVRALDREQTVHVKNTENRGNAMFESLYAQLLALPLGAALVLPLGVSARSAKFAVQSAVREDLKKRFSIGEHVIRPRRAEVLRHVRIERLADDT